MPWNDIKKKAQNENKMIFVDCFASWCGPCKRMDQTVFTDAAVAEFFDKYFVAVKVQMDETSGRAKLKLAKTLREEYEINAYPTFLYFNQSGKVLHRFVGAADVAVFLEESKKAMNPEAQFYTMIERFKSGQLENTKLKDMAYQFKFAGKGELANAAAESYFEKLTEEERHAAENIGFMQNFPESAKFQQYAAIYFRKLSSKFYLSDVNQDLIVAFRKALGVQNIVLAYLDHLPVDSLKNYTDLLLKLNDVSAVKEVVDRYLHSLSKDELYTADNLLLLANFTKSIEGPGFNLFYDSSTGLEAQRIIRQKPNYEKAKVVDFVDNIFRFGYLLKPYQSSLAGRFVDWQGWRSHLKVD